MRMTKLQKEIIKTLLFFNLHKRPLTSKEVYQYLGIKAQEGQVFLALLDLCRKKKVIEKNQFFVLKKYNSLFRNFSERQKIKQKLETKAKKFIWLFKLMPFVRAVFLANSLSMGLPNKNSDIDLVILTKKNRLWTCRFFLVGLLTLLGHKRAKNIKIAPGKFCPSYFVNLNQANLKEWSLKDDPLMNYWLATLKPLIGGQSIELFYSQNMWLVQKLPNLKIEVNNQKVKPLSFIAFLSEKILSILDDKMENYLFNIQAKKINAQNKPDLLIATRNICCLYQPVGGKKEFLKKFKKNLKNSNN